MKKETQIAVQGTPSLQLMVDQETENRKILTQFIKDHLKDGTDFGTIMIGGRASKPSLFKSGAEKFGSLMKLRPDVVKDGDTWEMSGSKEGLFCYRCNLYNSKNELVGMGLGACSLQEKNSYNNAIKIAKKRAFVDAILTTGALSDFFTQDLEDGTNETPQTSKQMRENASESSQTAQSNGNGNYKMTEKQKDFLLKLADEKELVTPSGKPFTFNQLLTRYDVTDVDQLTGEQASKIISDLLKLPKKQVEEYVHTPVDNEGKIDPYQEPEETIDNDEIEKGIEKQTA
jgi:hypothetical protein